MNCLNTTFYRFDNTLNLISRNSVRLRFLCSPYRGNAFTLFRWHGADHGIVVKMWSAWCKISGLVISCAVNGLGADAGVDTDGSAFIFAEGNELEDCVIYHAPGDGTQNPDWAGFRIAHTYNQNVDFMRARRCYFFAFGGGGDCIQVASGSGSLNSHSHIFDECIGWYADRFVNLVNGGFEARECFTEFIGSSGNADCFVYRLRGSEIASFIHSHNDENCQQFAYLNNQAPATFISCRIGTVPPAGKGLFQAVGNVPATIIGCSCTAAVPNGSYWVDMASSLDGANVWDINSHNWGGGFGTWMNAGPGHYVRLGTDSLSSGSINFGQNDLNFFEHGIWTPAFAGTGVSGAPTYGAQHGYYQCEGMKVTAWGTISLTNKGGMTGNIDVVGLPYEVAPSALLQFSNVVGQIFGVTCPSYLGISAIPGTQYASLPKNDGTGGGAAPLTDADITNGAAIAFMVVYLRSVP